MVEMQLAHPSKLLERLVDVPYSEALAGIVGYSSFLLALHLHLRGKVLVIFQRTNRRWEMKCFNATDSRNNSKIFRTMVKNVNLMLTSSI